MPALTWGGGAYLHWRSCLSRESAWCCLLPSQAWSERLAVVVCADSSPGKVETGQRSRLNVSTLVSRFQVQSGSKPRWRWRDLPNVTLWPPYCACVCVVPEDIKGLWIPWKWSYTWLLWSHLGGWCLELNSGPWQGQQVVLVSEPFVLLLK